MKKNIPNLITALRLLLLPVFIYVFFTVDDIRVAFAVFVFASATDLLDGYLARKWDAVSDFGKLFDPLADKLMQISAVVCLAFKGFIPWLPVIVALGKELAMVVGGLLIRRKRNVTVYSNNFGKLTSFFFSIVVCLCFFKEFWFYTETGTLVLNILVYVAVALSLASMVQYAVINVFQPAKNKAEQQHTDNDKEE